MAIEDGHGRRQADVPSSPVPVPVPVPEQGLGPRASLLRRAQPYVVPIAIAAVAVCVAWAFAATTLVNADRMGLPLDDSYIYLTYAKQFGRGQPFTYFPGGGYSAGMTSALWPMVLAPFWTLGARGHALVWVAFGLGTVLYACTAYGAYRFARGIAGEVAGLAAAALVLGLGPFAFAALAGMEVGFAAALLVALVTLLARAPKTGRPSLALALTLAAVSLSRPEAMVIAIAVCVTCAVQRARAREVRAAVLWLVPLAAPAAWLTANRVLAGHFMPNTGVVKSYFYLPGFDWTYWRTSVFAQLGALARGVFGSMHGPVPLGPLVGVAYVVGAVRVSMWAQREDRFLAGMVAIFAPLVLLLAVIATSGQWEFQNYRYIAPALPLVAMIAGVSLAPPRALPAEYRLPWLGGAGVALAAYVAFAQPRLVADIRLFAQGAMDTNGQVVRIGEYVRDRVPGASLALHDAGAIAYYGDAPVLDILGLVTNAQDEVSTNGPGARFEFLESLPPERRPTHFAYYAEWMGFPDFFGDVLVHTTLQQELQPGRLAGSKDLELVVASWDHVGTGERPLTAHDGWDIVDRVDIADIASEHGHRWSGALGRRAWGDGSTRWSVVEREALAQGLVIDGGRTIRGGHEQFAVALDPARPTRVILRTGGQTGYPPFHESITKPVTLRLVAGGTVLGEVTIRPPESRFEELAFELPAGTFHTREVELATEATGLYRVFHWFVLQPAAR